MDSVYFDKDLSHKEKPAEFQCGATINVHGEIMTWIGREHMLTVDIVDCCFWLHELPCGNNTCYTSTEKRFCFVHEDGSSYDKNLPDGYW